MALSVLDLFSVGIGPSSSHTVGPMRAAKRFADGLKSDGQLSSTAKVQAELFGSLGATGRGHGSDKAVVLGLQGQDPESVDTGTADDQVAAAALDAELQLAGGTVIALSISQKGIGFKFDLSQFNSVTTRAGKKFAGVKEGDSIMGVDILDLPNVLFLTTEGKAVVVAEKDIPLLTGAGKGVKLVNVKTGDVALVRAVNKGEQVKVIDDKGKEKVIELKNFGVMTRGSVGLKAVKAVRFV